MYKVQNKENIHINLIKIDNLLHNFDVKLYVIK